jgi:hypothetical protein
MRNDVSFVFGAVFFAVIDRRIGSQRLQVFCLGLVGEFPVWCLQGIAFAGRRDRAVVCFSEDLSCEIWRGHLRRLRWRR